MPEFQGGDVVWNFTANDSALTKGFSAADAGAKKLGMALTATGAVITGVFALAVSKAGTFRGAMAEVATLGISDLDGLSQGVRNTAKTFGLDLVDSAKAAYQAISAGVKETEAVAFLGEAAQAAAGGYVELSSAVDLGASVTNAFGKSMSEVNGVFDAAFLAVQKGVTTFGELSSSVGKVAPLFKAAGLSADEMFGSIAALTKGGVSTSEAVTQLKTVLAGIIKPTSDAIKAAEELGIEFNVAALESQGLEGFLQTLQEKTGGSIEKTARLFGSVEALGAVMALTGSQSEAFSEIMSMMTTKAGTAKEMFDIMAATDPGFAFRQMKAEMTDVMVTLGDALLPALKSLMELIIPLIKWVGEFAAAHPNLTSTMALLTAGVGLLMLVLGPLLLILPGITAGLGLLGGVGGAGAAAAGFTGLVGSAAAGTGIVGATAALAAPAGFIAVAAVGVVAGAALAVQATKTAVAIANETEMTADAVRSQQRMIDVLRSKGVVIDDVLLVGKSELEQLALIKTAIGQAEEAQKREISALNGVTQGYQTVGQAMQEALPEWQKVMNASVQTVLAKVKEEAEIKKLTRAEFEMMMEVKAATSAFEEQIDAHFKSEEAKIKLNRLTEEETALIDTSTSALQQSLEIRGDSISKFENEIIAVANAQESASAYTQRIFAQAEAMIMLAQAQEQVNRSRPSGEGGEGGGAPPGLQTGGRISESGVVDVHRNERIFLPKNAEVERAPLAGTGRGSGGNVTVNVSLDNVNLSSPDNINIFANLLAKNVQQELRAQGAF